MSQLRFDLLKLADQLEAEQRHLTLVRVIRRAYTVASAKTDLIQVNRYLALILRLQISGAMPAAFSDEDGSNIVGALFVASVIGYARAVISEPVDRWFWWSDKDLTNEQRATHDDVKWLRNKELAHFGKGRIIGDEALLTDCLYLSADVNTTIGYRSSIWSTRPEFVIRFAQLAGQVLTDAEQRVEVEFETVYANIARLATFDNSLQSLVERFPIDDPRLSPGEASEPAVNGKHTTHTWTTVTSRGLRDPQTARPKTESGG